MSTLYDCTTQPCNFYISLAVLFWLSISETLVKTEREVSFDTDKHIEGIQAWKEYMLMIVLTNYDEAYVSLHCCLIEI